MVFRLFGSMRTLPEQGRPGCCAKSTSRCLPSAGLCTVPTSGAAGLLVGPPVAHPLGKTCPLRRKPSQKQMSLPISTRSTLAPHLCRRTAARRHDAEPDRSGPWTIRCVNRICGNGADYRVRHPMTASGCRCAPFGVTERKCCRSSELMEANLRPLSLIEICRRRRVCARQSTACSARKGPFGQPFTILKSASTARICYPVAHAGVEVGCCLRLRLRSHFSSATANFINRSPPAGACRAASSISLPPEDHIFCWRHAETWEAQADTAMAESRLCALLFRSFHLLKIRMF